MNRNETERKLLHHCTEIQKIYNKYRTKYNVCNRISIHTDVNGYFSVDDFLIIDGNVSRNKTDMDITRFEDGKIFYRIKKFEKAEEIAQHVKIISDIYKDYNRGGCNLEIFICVDEDGGDISIYDTVYDYDGNIILDKDGLMFHTIHISKRQNVIYRTEYYL